MGGGIHEHPLGQGREDGKAHAVGHEQAGKGARLLVKVKEGIEAEPAKKLVAALKEGKLKVQASIQDGQLRVTGKNKDDLQKAIALLRGGDFGLELQFVNFRD